MVGVLRLSDIGKFCYPCLIKFSNSKEHLEALQNGQMYMNKLGVFTDLEKKNGVKGMGDDLEAAGVIVDLDVSILDYESNIEILKLHSSKMTIRFEYCLNKPVFCLFAVTPDMLEMIEDQEQYYQVRIEFSNEQKEQIPKHFGEYALVIHWAHFMDRVKNEFEKHGYSWVAKLVEYSDFNTNIESRIRAYVDETNDMFFWKDSALGYQNEYRIVILSEDVKSHVIKDIGSVKDISFIVKTQDLMDGRYGFSILKKVIE